VFNGEIPALYKKPLTHARSRPFGGRFSRVGQTSPKAKIWQTMGDWIKNINNLCTADVQAKHLSSWDFSCCKKIMHRLWIKLCKQKQRSVTVGITV
jgi:hypothetical protein